jgi:transcriptional regulator with GAF, ATPase, and Fis domain
MSGRRETLGHSDIDDLERRNADPIPGLLLVFGAGRPATVCVPLVDGAVELGRDHVAFRAHPDPRMSRRHVQVRLEQGRWTVTDLGSRNGAMVDGGPVAPGTTIQFSRLLRIGDSLLIPVSDLGPLQSFGVRVADGRVEGPGSQRTALQVVRLAQFGSTLHITGESGVGKEGLARAFHAAGPNPKGPLQTVNCAAIPEGVAERLLFGTRRGAYSGADADAEGYVQAAHGGTLFLDEVAELSLPVQAKLLRTLETGEVLPLGASRPRKVDLRFCSATHHDLRRQVVEGKFREDLFYRITAPSIMASPLRDRPEEIPWLLLMEVERTTPGRALHVSLVETCLLRRWPGNVRELLREARCAAQLAHADEAPRVKARHLGATAGIALDDTSEPSSSAATPESSRQNVPATTPSRSSEPAPADPVETPASPPRPPARARVANLAKRSAAPAIPPTRARLLGALRQAEGNISAAARLLGVHRTQLKRWLDRQGIDASSFASDAKDDPSN